MHAFICANASAISQSVSRVLYENDRNIQDVDDIALVDFDCALGLNTIAFIEHMRIIGQEKRIKEVLLIDDNKACLERAELLVSTVAPSITVKTLMKPINQISPEEVKLEHMLVYHIFCGLNNVSKGFMQSVSEKGRYLLSKVIYSRSVYDSGFCSYEGAPRYNFIENINLESVIISEVKNSKNPGSFIDINDYIPNSHIEDEFSQVVSSFIKTKPTNESECYSFFSRRYYTQKNSISVALNYAICLLHGIGRDIDKEGAFEALQQWKKELDEIKHPNVEDEIIKSKTIDVMAQSLNLVEGREQERILLMKEFLSLNIDEHDKCRTRFNYSLTLDDKTAYDEEKSLLEKCIKYGCRSCHEASNYNLDIMSCPRAQHRLAQIMYSEKKEKEESLSLLQKAVEQGCVMAERSLGFRYYYGIGIPKDTEKAVELYSKAAGKGEYQACMNLFEHYKYKEPRKALWYLALAYSCKWKENKVIEKLQTFIPDVVSGDTGTKLVEEVLIRAAEDGIKEFKQRAIDILLKRAQLHMLTESFDDVKSIYEGKLRNLDSELANNKLNDFWDSVPEWYLREVDAEMELHEDSSPNYSLMDALDGEPDAYWNID